MRLGGNLVLPADRAASVPDQPGVYQVQFTMPGPGTSFSRTLQLLVNDVASSRLQIDF